MGSLTKKLALSKLRREKGIRAAVKNVCGEPTTPDEDKALEDFQKFNAMEREMRDKSMEHCRTKFADVSKFAGEPKMPDLRPAKKFPPTTSPFPPSAFELPASATVPNKVGRSLGAYAEKFDTKLPDTTNPKDLLGAMKVDPAVVPPVALYYTALGMMNGATKYGPFNWREKKVLASIYAAAAKRHIDAWFDGQDIDEGTEEAPGSMLPHLSHALACLAIIVDALECDALIDDRPSPGGTSRFLAHWNPQIKGLKEKWLASLKK